MNKNLISAAIQELQNPTFEVTKQYLETHKIRYNEYLLRIDTDQDATAIVYFSIENEYYYVAVYLDTKPEIEVKGISMEAGSKVYLVIRSETLTLEELLSKITFIPTEKWSKGDLINKFAIRKDSGITIDLDSIEPDELENKVNKLVNYLYQYSEEIKNLASCASVTLQIAYYGYHSQMHGWYIDRITLKKIAELNLEVDFDIYAGGLPLEDH